MTFVEDKYYRLDGVLKNIGEEWRIRMETLVGLRSQRLLNNKSRSLDLIQQVKGAKSSLLLKSVVGSTAGALKSLPASGHTLCLWAMVLQLSLEQGITLQQHQFWPSSPHLVSTAFYISVAYIHLKSLLGAEIWTHLVCKY